MLNNHLTKEIHTTHLAQLLLIGLNHNTAPLKIREQFAFREDELSKSLCDILDADRSITEVVIVSTCNRIEIYAFVTNATSAKGKIEEYWASHANVPVHTLNEYVYCKHGTDVVEHVMIVASGLDSMILGETQILGQVNRGFNKAQFVGTCGSNLSHLFTQAIHAGKRAHHETEISCHTTSVSHAAVHMAKSQVPNLEYSAALVIGSGEMALLAAQAFQRNHVSTIRCINRTLANAERLAEQVGGEVLAWKDLSHALTISDVVVTATGAPHTIIHTDDVEKILPLRGGRPLVLIDIALPTDVDEDVRRLVGVHYYHLDDLQTFVNGNIVQREAAIEDVQDIIREEVNRFFAWQSGRQVVPTIAALREKAVRVAHNEVDDALRRLGDIDEHSQKIVERLAHRIVNKILHEPITRLKAEAHQPHYASVIRDLFALDG